ncbi:MAG: nitrate reductase subunit alpha [Candidatus Obscuribacter sp.]|nr:nitrate reductase subunit alpha [Candidatus Obscuribacter sp.]MDQ5965314.1 nitrate reductase / nitrite oxidoreductase, alpha subunit [Cyanobacteriota bacterium erpe_2018_sw_39hr_WHONDRS-SW48-000098_B_bin.30]MBK7839692.1 nitrate reductase subunit alpha [Candidatus Obscuribacter sp.]MBK9202393.1 nitrate reductase subunit alpha [Candidatus Obscuribacter sp.]MBK9618817.1 nitrate reductase subunit alpha [Candidatus Obscuribacter sp.]
MAWIKDIFAPKQRQWEDFYRNRWQYDKIVRSTHGVNCTGSCSWNVYVKSGIVTWELQALDYPIISKDIPPHEPRGCQRGISCSWYLYSPLRVKYPYMRGALLDLWRAAKEAHPGDHVAAWQSIVSDPASKTRYHQARGKGGFRRVNWDEAHEIIAAANIATIKRHGPDRIVGFSPIPAMSMVSYASGARFLQLMGGVNLSFYDWYCDLPPASPETWGEQTDVAESADWFHSKFVAVVGSNVLMTRTPDAHFLVEGRHQGSKVVVFSPDFSQVSKIADEWVPIHQGQDTAFWMAVTHVILKEFYCDKQTPYFTNYVKKYSDMPFLVTLKRGEDGHYAPGKLLRASQLEHTKTEENADWKMFVLDSNNGKLFMPEGTIGHRWQSHKGHWNLKLEDPNTGKTVDPALTIAETKVPSSSVMVNFPDFSNFEDQANLVRNVSAMEVTTIDGPVMVTTALELMIAQYGVKRGLAGDYPANYEDEKLPYTPAWQEKFTGVSAATVIKFAREWATTAEQSKGKCSVIIGAGANHWYHNNLIYRSIIAPLILCGCVGVNGGGLNHYVGQEKLAPQASWAPIAFGTDWSAPPRLQNAPSFHYIHSDQWRYDANFDTMCAVADESHSMAHGHTADKQAIAVRSGWLPCYPQFNQSNLTLVEEAKAQGAKTEGEIIEYIVKQLKERTLKFSMEDPDNIESSPKVWYIWRGNALLSSAKGHEYFLKHYLGTHNNAIAQEVAKDLVEEVTWHDKVELGKMDLIVDLNYRMDSSALYSDIVLPAATYYEKHDLNTTDMHSFIHPLQPAVPPCWESKSDWEIFKGIAEVTAKLSEKHLPDPITDVVATPLMHDTPAEMAQARVLDWAKGECQPIPGKTMPSLKLVTRDYPNLANKFKSLGPNVRANGLSVHGTHYDIDDIYDRYMETSPTEKWGGHKYPSLSKDLNVCELILLLAAETNGELAYRAFEAESQKTGIDHTHLARDTRSVHYTFNDLKAQPRRVLTTPFWTGITNGERTYSAYCQNIEEQIPWRTLTGRQHLYLDHETYVAFGEHLPTYKPRPTMHAARDLEKSARDAGSLVLNYLTPHGKWHIHSTFGDTLRMKTLSRGIEPIWLNDKDADLIGIEDNDWVEAFNDHGVVCTRACVSARIPRGLAFIYHSPERTVAVPKSKERGMRRAGGHNSLTRARLKPLFMIGGYAQFTYAFNYWGPPGVNRDTFVIVKPMDKVEY